MSESVLGRQRRALFDRLPSFTLEAVRHRLVRVLARIEWGQIELVDPTHGTTLLGQPSNPGPRVRVLVHDPLMYSYIGLGGSIGAGQSYFLGMWDTNALSDVVRIMVHSRFVLDALDAGWSMPSHLIYTYMHWRRQNSLRNSRANISAHYDIGDDFFELMLDPTMMYSAAVFSEPAATLEMAQVEKLDRICRKLELNADDHLLEIGTGWGAMACHAAQHYGCRVTTTTISENQFQHAQARAQRLGLADRVTAVKRDYRELQGQYDKLVSIEMIEAVGYRYFDTYFGQIGRLLKPTGLALIQAITIEDARFDQYRRGADFIRRFIFPGGCLPSISSMLESTTRTSDLTLVHLDDIGLHYATTLQHWSAACTANEERILSLGYTREFLRMWQFYLSYCEGGFRERSIGDAQLLLARPFWRARA